MIVATTGFCAFAALVMCCTFFAVSSHYHGGCIWGTLLGKCFREKAGPSAHSTYGKNKRDARLRHLRSLEQLNGQLEKQGYSDDIKQLSKKGRKETAALQSKFQPRKKR